VSYNPFGSPDPLERYNAHQEAKGRPTLPDSDRIRKAQKENPERDADFSVRSSIGDETAKQARGRLDG
jgi:hypothetical protein